MKILVVDDELLLVKGMKFNLENEGYTVETAYDGATAIDMAKSGGFDPVSYTHLTLPTNSRV